MLYLAEVQKQKTGFMASTSKAEIKLLASQRADHSWQPVPGEEVIPAEEANNFNAGMLVLADLNSNRQVQRIQEAGRPLLSILQNLSRSLEKFKHQEEEIQQWKQSLTYQSQELNRRNIEMETRLEQLQQIEDDFQRLEEQRQEIDNAREIVERLRQENERNSRDLAGAWEHLRGEQRRWQDQQTELQPAPMLDEQVRQIQELIARLSSGVAPTEVRQILNSADDQVTTQQETLNQHWQQLQQYRESAAEQQNMVDCQAQSLHNSSYEWQQAQNSLDQALLNLHVQTSVLNCKQEYAQMLSHKLRNQERLYQQLSRLIATSKVDSSKKVDPETLAQMPLDQLQQLVHDLQRDLQKSLHFVNDQEEELELQQQHIEKLQAQLIQTNDNNRPSLETELAEEQVCYQFLNETLVGQRQNIQAREQILNQHQAVLWQRQGNSKPEPKNLDLEMILVQFKAEQKQQSQELQKLEQQVEQMRSSIEQTQLTTDNQVYEQQMQQQELQNLEQSLVSQKAAIAECWGQIKVYEEMLQPFQDQLNELRNYLGAIADTLDQLEQTGNYQLQTISEMHQTLLSFVPVVEVTAIS